MRQYLDLERHIMTNGATKTDRTGTGTKSIFGHQMRFNLQESFPLLTTKKVPVRLVLIELFWILSGDTNIKYLVDNDCHIWNEWPFRDYLKKMGLPIHDTDSEEWRSGLAEFISKIKNDAEFAKENGNLGPVYGKQWRAWSKFVRQWGPKLEDDGSYYEKPIDQISEVVARIKSKPDDRRLIVTAWNPADIEKVTLPWCHCFFQFYVANGKLSCQMYQRSCDTFLGVPFNIASYSLLTMMIAQVCDLEPGEFIWTGGDVHIYSNHFDQVNEQLSREPRALPTMRINPKVKDLFSFKLEDFELIGYDPYPAIKAPVAV